MSNFRRRIARLLARLLARLTIVVDPDPPMKITTVRRIPDDYEMTKALADIISGQTVGYGVAGRRFDPGTGTDYAY